MHIDFDIEYAGTCGRDRNILIVRRPDIPAPKKRISTLTIPGRDGSLYIDEEAYEDIDIAIEMNYMSKDKDLWHEDYRRCKRWLLHAKDDVLKFSDDPTYYRRVRKVEIDTNVRNSMRIGKFTATFTVAPYEYRLDGNRFMTAEECRDNPLDMCKPCYCITGEGKCTLTVNGKSVTVEVGQNVTLDTEKKVAYRKDGTLVNTAMTGYHEDLWMSEGRNEITVTNGFDLKIKPNWRCL